MQVQPIPQNQASFKAWSATRPLIVKGLYREKGCSGFIDYFFKSVVKKSPELEQFAQNHNNVRIQLNAFKDENNNIKSTLTVFFDKLITNKFITFINKILHRPNFKHEKVSISTTPSPIERLENNETKQLVGCIVGHECQIKNDPVSKDIRNGISLLDKLHNVDPTIPTNLVHAF